MAVRMIKVLVIAAISVAVLRVAAYATTQNEWLALPEEEISRIAFGSCAKQWQHQTIWDAVIAEEPDLFLFLGDAVYADTDGKTAWDVSKDQLKGEWARLVDKPEFQRAMQKMPFMATWDNHDYGTHAGGAEFKLKQESKEIFLDFFGEHDNSPRRKRDGVYDAKIFGPVGKRVQVILLDTKYNRSPFRKDPAPKDERLKKGKVGGYLPDDDPAKTHLGQAQWQWLQDQLRKPSEVRLICSSTQVIPNQKGMDEWGNFPLERKKLFDLIANSGAKGVILLSGNVHFAELSKSYVGGYPLFELTSSGMTHIDETYAKAANEYRIAGPFIDHNIGLVEIAWDAKPSPLVTLKVIGGDGRAVFSHPVRLGDLRSSRVAAEKALVSCPEPRPEVCTQKYRPVCAERKDGRRRTYSNGCTACSDHEVIGYTEDECEE